VTAVETEANIEWNPQDPRQMNIRDWLIENNPRKKQGGISWHVAGVTPEETRKAAAPRGGPRKFNLKDHQIQPAISFLAAIDKGLGVRAQDLLGDFLLIQTMVALMENPEIVRQLDGPRGSDPRIRGGMFYLRGNQIAAPAEVARNVEKGLKAVLYAAEKFETCTSAGKAPTDELKNVFQNWLTNYYKNI
jgi:hypothetical protein